LKRFSFTLLVNSPDSRAEARRGAAGGRGEKGGGSGRNSGGGRDKKEGRGAENREAIFTQTLLEELALKPASSGYCLRVLLRSTGKLCGAMGKH
jgi:hypothetical protein